MNLTARSILVGLALCAAPIGAQETISRGDIPPADLAPIALMLDLSTGQTLYAREADRRFVPASITKVMTMYVAFELMNAGKLSINQRFTVSDSAFREWSGRGSSMFLGDRDRLTAEELMLGITTVSANDACVVLAEGAAGSVDGWVALMNREAHMLGMNQSHFGTPNGWPDEGQTFTTAEDLAILAEALFSRHPHLYYRFFGYVDMTYGGITQSNHDPITGFVPGADGIKTGYTRQSGYGFLGTARRNGRRLVMIVAGADSSRARERAARDFIEWGFSAFERRNLFGKGAKVAEAAVQGGATWKVPLEASRAIGVAFAHGTQPELSLRLSYDGPLKAPIAVGSNVAQLSVLVDGREVQHVPLVAGADVPEANIWQRLRNGLLGIVA